MNRRDLRQRASSHQPSATGFTLIEVLVTVLLLSIGLLGLAKLQFWGVKHTGSAYFRTQATLLANELIERVRANPRGLAAGSYQLTSRDCEHASINCNAGFTVDCTTEQCAPEVLAQFDLRELACGAKVGDGLGADDLLPAGKIWIGQQTCEEEPAQTCQRVEVCWSETDSGWVANRIGFKHIIIEFNP